MKNTEILERKVAKKQILQNFLGVDKEIRKLMVASVQKDNIYGCQFHPEKSGDVGLNILKAFCEMGD